jgi:hypothetical protein
MTFIQLLYYRREIQKLLCREPLGRYVLVLNKGLLAYTEKVVVFLRKGEALIFAAYLGLERIEIGELDIDRWAELKRLSEYTFVDSLGRPIIYHEFDE